MSFEERSKIGESFEESTNATVKELQFSKIKGKLYADPTFLAQTVNPKSLELSMEIVASKLKIARLSFLIWFLISCFLLEYPPTHNSKTQMSDAMQDDIDDGLRFRNCNCFCGMRASVRISDKRNENRYRLFQCCPKDACRFFQWCIPMKTPLSYAEEFQQLQEELCVLREELRPSTWFFREPWPLLSFTLLPITLPPPNRSRGISIA
nr:hypothetical protein CFP56_55077 [Quercus suber]